MVLWPLAMPGNTKKIGSVERSTLYFIPIFSSIAFKNYILSLYEILFEYMIIKVYGKIHIPVKLSWTSYFNVFNSIYVLSISKNFNHIYRHIFSVFLCAQMIIKLFLVCVSLKAKPIKNLMKICRAIIIKLSRFPIDWTYKCCRFTPWGCRLDMKNTWEMWDSMNALSLFPRHIMPWTRKLMQLLNYLLPFKHIVGKSNVVVYSCV